MLKTKKLHGNSYWVQRSGWVWLCLIKKFTTNLAFPFQTQRTLKLKAFRIAIIENDVVFVVRNFRCNKIDYF